MPPAARRICSSSFFFIAETPVNIPTFPGCEDAAEGAALAQAAAQFTVGQQHFPHMLPVTVQQALPLKHGRGFAVLQPAGAIFPRKPQPIPLRIAVYLFRNSEGQRQTAPIYFLMGSHASLPVRFKRACWRSALTDTATSVISIQIMPNPALGVHGSFWATKKHGPGAGPRAVKNNTFSVYCAKSLTK